MKYSNNLNLVEHMLIWVQNSTKAQIKNELEYSITKVNDLRSVFCAPFCECIFPMYTTCIPRYQAISRRAFSRPGFSRATYPA